MSAEREQRENWSYPPWGRLLGAVFVTVGAGLVCGILERSESADAATVGCALFALILALMGGVFLTSRQGVVIDPAAGQVTTWSSVFWRKREHRENRDDKPED